MAYPQEKADQQWTYADYLTWDDGQRWELIAGEAFCMSPAPSRYHQQLSVRLERQIDRYVQDKPCELYHAPFDVRLSRQPESSDNYVETVVQPDIVVVCDRAKLDDKGCNGAPDLVIEITSPNTARMDLTVKFDLYEKHGVKEYWIVHPVEKTVMAFRLQPDGCYGAPDRYAGDDQVPVPLLGDLVVDLAEVFRE